MADVDSTVQYRDVPGFPGYRVGDDGSVWTKWHKGHYGPGGGRGTYVVLGEHWRPMKATRASNNYLMVSLYNGRRFGRLVHRLVLESFVGPCPSGMEGCHYDGDRMNNCLANLRWDTRRNNHADKHQHGTDRLGEKTPNAKLTAAAVKEIRRRYATGEVNQRQLADEHNVTFSNIYSIICRRTWRHVG